MMIGVQNIVINKHAAYLEFPPLGFEPRFGFWPFTKEKLVFPGDDPVIVMFDSQRLSQ